MDIQVHSLIEDERTKFQRNAPRDFARACQPHELRGRKLDWRSGSPRLLDWWGFTRLVDFSPAYLVQMKYWIARFGGFERIVGANLLPMDIWEGVVGQRLLDAAFDKIGRRVHPGGA